ncbi:hypothetical protein [Metabacillus iocasae]|uniref:Uncharacterized protein n=1 Tax=Priestia iocasae TaxID=2291674 RepID=A0ABS2QRD0_9BACI|nr:hypothetical protein [Metabacillus iocasae]MBM7701532.1 hypothetical protein [Metabacillus iocasae]
MQRILLVILGLLLLIVSYRMRYRVVNLILGSSAIRSLAIRSLLNIPYVKDKLLGQVFRYS